MATPTNEEIVEKCNELARVFYKSHGCEVPDGYRFDQAEHPMERGMWNLAAMAFDFIEGTDVDDALCQLEENGA